ncbi:putative mitochondrial hypothetical protein [Leptomonas pyrrhocoris]|uniref:Uncharacterized protein n=1 Tax=Leptomonas pyrrhocoris TaxID=157538 RepID=A0A0M9FZ54_LEPPY|nr:putative mitochondrial hypothetical protein [Leptomonas pyrrhocoris]XP_015657285.1 putative mitochondrial hypothetical protein [Leptomonas pyrrhocoris]KPA78845.1 putative mitochondrial hypothetical protein [Leptomonas pyrrhocoris]KPA78846.1 putative mitochondrial hypothetical protein [Leptomonas pyrrhocoris]|eukprot:XP_015657284.1 putative mitochondrial hypothetical protein [Leptomonas pyrrhocoris]
MSFRRSSTRIAAAMFLNSLCLPPTLAPPLRSLSSTHRCRLPCFTASAHPIRSQFRLLHTDDRSPVSSTATRQSAANSQATGNFLGEGADGGDGEKPGTKADAEADDDVTVQVYRPQLSPEAAERSVKTELFLCLLLTLPRTQDWKDMLTAAFRAGSWKPHHLDAVLRGVSLNKYNEPSAFLRSCGSSYAAANGNQSLREAAVQASQSAPPASTPTSRLHRARDILVFCAEEGVLYAKEDEETTVAAPPSSSSSPAPSVAEGKATLMHADAFAPSPAAVHHLLTMLLQAAQRGADYASSSPSPHPASTSSSLSTSSGENGLPTASYADVWHYLAWMELHGYHVLSHAVLDVLEAALDEGGSPSRPQGHRTKAGITAAESTDSISSSGPLQYAAVSQRIHRLDYVRGERALLQESLRSQSKMKKNPVRSLDHVGDFNRRQRDVPRTDPTL